MGILIMRDENGSSELLDRIRAGDLGAIDPLFTMYRERLKRMIRLRLNRRLKGRIDESDILQEALIEASQRLPDYLKESEMPFYLWVRYIAGQKLTDAHRRHLGTQMRDAAQEISLHRGAFPAASTASLAAQLVGQFSSPSQAAIKAEMRIRVQETLNAMDPTDREILAMRHFEQLSNTEIAQLLGLSESGATARYLRALKRFKEIIAAIPGFFDQ